MSNTNKELGLPNYNETETERTKKTVASADEVETPLQASRTTTEGARVDLQEKVFPDLYERPEREYKAPPTNLAERVSHDEIRAACEEVGGWAGPGGCGPARSEAEAPLLAGTRVVESPRGRK